MKRKISVEKRQLYVNDVPGEVTYYVRLVDSSWPAGTELLILSSKQVQELILRLSEAVK